MREERKPKSPFYVVYTYNGERIEEGFSSHDLAYGRMIDLQWQGIEAHTRRD